MDVINLLEEKSKPSHDYSNFVNTPLIHDKALPIEFCYGSYALDIRRAKLILFRYVLLTHDEFTHWDDADLWDYVRKLEVACHNATIKKAYDENIICSYDDELFCSLYHSICYRVSSNLDRNSLVNNKTLIKKILNKEITISELPLLSSVELYPEIHQDIIDKVEASKHVKINYKISALYKCPKCKKQECRVSDNLYNRSLDEGVNLIITCLHCGHEFSA